MSIKKIGILSIIALAFAASFLTIIVRTGTRINAPKPKSIAAWKPIKGKLFIPSIDDLRVGDQKIVLCGAAFTKPRSMRALVTETARRNYQRLSLTCKAVGTGTPCDGNVAAKFNDAIVVQCFTADGTDLASKLVESGILCGQPTQAGSTYKGCSPGS
ncbi:hypothetical protein [Mesorhizobium sp. M0768]|uniref:hypothetical protein n=1 Tax=Mesorhizobium sp. M0768 TaxID=2956996 RepID=UPI00333D354E